MKEKYTLPYRRLVVDIDPKLHQKLKVIAKKADRSVSKQVKVILANLLADPKVFEKVLDSK